MKRELSRFCWTLPTAAGFSLLFVACARPQPIAIAPETSAVRLSTAIVPLNAILSCHGGAFCREDVVRPEATDATNEVTEDCARRGGTLERGACSRSDVAASCGGSTEWGSVLVFTYARDEVSKMEGLCEAMGGELAIAR